MADAGEKPILLDVERVVKRFGGVAAVGGLTMKVREGSVHGLIGPNGAGKTTLINLITGLFHPDEGTIHFAGKRLEKMAPQDIAALGITRTYQNVRLFSGMSVLEQVITGCFLEKKTGLFASFLGLPSARADWKRVSDHAMELLRRVRMDHRANELAETLSYGEQRRIEIARALGSNPRLILLDEPTAGMNHSEATEVGRLTHELRDAGLTILMVEHNMGLVTEFCDSCTVMNFGQLLAEGDPKTCIANPDVQEAYFGRKNDATRIKALR
jgi:branched-chain amino acid transport system ATP-binding protein